MTQMRLRRLMRTHAAEVARLRERPFSRAQREETVRDLLGQTRKVRQGWAEELAAAPPARPGDTAERQVQRRIVALETAIAMLAQPSADLERARAEFADSAVPLLLMLRGLDGYSETAALETGPAPLARSA